MNKNPENKTNNRTGKIKEHQAACGWNVTYILECRDGSLYTGWTNNMPRRWAAHVAGTGCKYTHSHPPASIAYLEVSDTKETAMQREYAIKQLPRVKKQQLIADGRWRDLLPDDLQDFLAKVN